MSEATARHPQHDAIAETIRETYRQSNPVMGYRVERHPLGWFQFAPAGTEFGTITLDAVEPAAVSGLAAEIPHSFGEVPVSVYVEGRDRDAALAPVLAAAGFVADERNAYVAFVGELPPKPSRAGALADVTIEEVDSAGLETWARVKLQGFGDSEDEPDSEKLAAEMALRRAENRGSGRSLLASVHGEPAAVLGLWGETDRVIFNLATRLPFRRRRLAELLLAEVLHEAADDPGCRSVVINGEEEDWPLSWYRRYGFSDEVLWRRRYRLSEPLTPPETT